MLLVRPDLRHDFPAWPVPALGVGAITAVARTWISGVFAHVIEEERLVL